MKNTLKNAITFFTAAALLLLSACGSSTAETTTASSDESSTQTYKIGICNYVDDASLNQIVDSIEEQLETIGAENNVTFDIEYDNCNADANVLQQIIAKFVDDKVDLMIGVATPVAMAMQAATEDNQIPVVFAAVSDPVSCGIVESMDAPGANITGTSDMLNTKAIIDLMFANDPDIDSVGLLYDAGQDSSTSAIAEAKAYLEEKGVEVTEYTGTNVEEISIAAAAFAEDGVDAVFTPSDNTVMQAELSIYETFVNAGILQYCGADSFALNGAFCGYGVNYANLGVETGKMAADILMNDKDPKDVAVMTFDNGIATYNEDVIEALGLDVETIRTASEPYCNDFATIKTAESFE